MSKLDGKRLNKKIVNICIHCPLQMRHIYHFSFRNRLKSFTLKLVFVIETNLPFKGCKQKRAGYLIFIFLMKIKSDFGEINFKSQNPKFLL